MNRIQLALSMVVFSLLLGCQKVEDLENVDRVLHSGEYAVPLISTQTSLKDILEDFQDSASLVVRPDGELRFMYQGDVLTKTSEDIFVDINNTIPPIIPVVGPRMALPFSSPDGLDIDQLNVKSGLIRYAFQSDHSSPLNVTIRFPQVTKNGNPLTFQTNIVAYSGSGDLPTRSNLFSPATLDGFEIIPENDSIYVEYEAIVQGTDSSVLLQNVIIQIENFTFSYAEGYLGQQLYEGDRDTIIIDFFDSWIQGDIYFADPQVTFFFENSFGIPTRSIVETFDIFSVKGDILQLESEFIENGIDFPYPELNNVGASITETFTFTKDNSNIDVVLGQGPVAIDYKVDAITNPDSITSIRGFITDSSFYKVKVEVELPLIGRATSFAAQDTFDIDFTDFDAFDYAEFKLVADNELPLDVDVQGYFISADGIVIDSLLDQPTRIVSGAPIDVEGNANGVGNTVTFIPYPEERFSEIKEAKSIIIQASFWTVNDGNTSVRVLADQEINIRIGMIAGYENE